MSKSFLKIFLKNWMMKYAAYKKPEQLGFRAFAVEMTIDDLKEIYKQKWENENDLL